MHCDCSLQVGDIINITSKPPMGIWTGMLSNKVGNFKFIYVDVVADKEEEEEVPKIRQQKLSKRPRPKTLLELLERLNLEVRAGAEVRTGKAVKRVPGCIVLDVNKGNQAHRLDVNT